MFVHKFNRVFNGDDMTLGVLVSISNHGRERGRFTGTGCAHKYNQATFGHRKLNRLRQLQIINAGDFCFDPTAHHTRISLVKGTDPELAGDG